jgi:hypothetical protein
VSCGLRERLAPENPLCCKGCLPGKKFLYLLTSSIHHIQTSAFNSADSFLVSSSPTEVLSPSISSRSQKVPNLHSTLVPKLLARNTDASRVAMQGICMPCSRVQVKTFATQYVYKSILPCRSRSCQSLLPLRYQPRASPCVPYFYTLLYLP